MPQSMWGEILRKIEGEGEAAERLVEDQPDILGPPIPSTTATWMS